jgi:Rgg/GadR/MutR family transcriptional activator
MEVWEIVDRVRRQKGISINEVCGDEVSRSVYERFVKNTADTTVTKFTYFLQRINLDYDELKIFNYPKETNIIQRMMEEMIVAFMSRDTEELQRIADFCRDKESMLSKREEHLISLCEMMVARLNNEQVDVQNSSVYQYLINAQTWTRYELVLFNNSMYAFTPEFVEMILERALVSLSVYKDSRQGRSESFRMLSNSVIYFIQHNQRTFAWKYLEKLGEFYLEEDMYFEKNVRLLLNGVWDTIRGNNKGIEKVHQSLQVCQFLSSNQHYKMNVDLLRYIEKMFNVDFKLEK